MSDDHSVWKATFDHAQRESQEQADKDAWRAIAGILMGIITVGLCLSALTIFLVTRFPT